MDPTIDPEVACSEDEYSGSHSTHLSTNSEPLTSNKPFNNLYHGTWPVERTIWNSETNSIPMVYNTSAYINVTIIKCFFFRM